VLALARGWWQEHWAQTQTGQGQHGGMATASTPASTGTLHGQTGPNKCIHAHRRPCFCLLLHSSYHPSSASFRSSKHPARPSCVYPAALCLFRTRASPHHKRLPLSPTASSAASPVVQFSVSFSYVPLTEVNHKTQPSACGMSLSYRNKHDTDTTQRDLWLHQLPRREGPKVHSRYLGQW
jgi:hypothetical protein